MSNSGVRIRVDSSSFRKNHQKTWMYVNFNDTNSIQSLEKKIAKNILNVKNNTKLNLYLDNTILPSDENIKLLRDNDVIVVEKKTNLKRKRASDDDSDNDIIAVEPHEIKSEDSVEKIVSKSSGKKVVKRRKKSSSSVEEITDKNSKSSSSSSSSDEAANNKKSAVIIKIKKDKNKESSSSSSSSEDEPPKTSVKTNPKKVVAEKSSSSESSSSSDSSEEEEESIKILSNKTPIKNKESSSSSSSSEEEEEEVVEVKKENLGNNSKVWIVEENGIDDWIVKKPQQNGEINSTLNSQNNSKNKRTRKRKRQPKNKNKLPAPLALKEDGGDPPAAASAGSAGSAGSASLLNNTTLPLNSTPIINNNNGKNKKFGLNSADISCESVLLDDNVPDLLHLLNGGKNDKPVKGTRNYLRGNKKNKSFVDCEEDFSNYPIIVEVPKVGEIIAFRVLEMDENYSPVMSSHKKATVLNVENQSINVKIVGDVRRKNGRFELDVEGLEDDNNLKSFTWSDLQDVRLIN